MGWGWEDGRMGFPRQFIATVLIPAGLGTGISPKKVCEESGNFGPPKWPEEFRLRMECKVGLSIS